MQYNNQDQENLARLGISSTQNGVQIAQEEEDRPSEAHAHQSPIQRSQWTPANQGNANPDQIGVSVQRPLLDQVGAGAPEPAKRAPQSNGDDARVSVDQASGTGKQSEVVFEVLVVVVGEPLGDGAGEEENHDDGGCDPEGAVKVRVSF